MKKLIIILVAGFVFSCGFIIFPNHTNPSISFEYKWLKTLEETPLVKFFVKLEKSQRGRQLVEAINKILDDSLTEAVDDSFDEDQMESEKKQDAVYTSIA
jgi:hypothetical protein